MNGYDYVSSCGIPLMPVVYQVVGFGRSDDPHSDRQQGQHSVISERCRCLGGHCKVI